MLICRISSKVTLFCGTLIIVNPFSRSSISLLTGKPVLSRICSISCMIDSSILQQTFRFLHLAMFSSDTASGLLHIILMYNPKKVSASEEALFSAFAACESATTSKQPEADAEPKIQRSA
jgi:hypothetical protein